MKKKYYKWLLLIPVLGVYLAGMFIDVMEPDAAQYAAITQEMLDTGNYLEIYYRGEDYIDKPPLLFWTSALAFKVFGVSNFSYKLPSVLFTLLGLFATYRLGKLLYGKKTGYYAVLILASCQAWFLINHDVRTDTILAACTILSIWQLVEFDKKGKTINVIYAALGIAGAMLTKGPIGLMVPALAIGTDYVLKRSWGSFFRWQWILLLFLITICLAPMLYGLYTQFDLSKGKETYNGVITSGLRFYFWTQSFGRLTGESTWKNSSDPFFFVHTFLWAFLPWSILFIVAFWKRLKDLWQQKFLISLSAEAITIGGIILPFIAFSISQYKLPHYIFVILPLASLLTSRFLYELMEEDSDAKQLNALRVIQIVISMSLLIIALALCTLSFPLYHFTTWMIVILGLLLILYYIFYRGSGFRQLVLPSFLAITIVNFLLNTHFYPSLLAYQAESVAAQFVRASPPYYELVGFHYETFSLDFYNRKNVSRIDDVSELRRLYKSQRIWVITTEEGNKELLSSGFMPLVTKKIQDFHVSRVTMRFLNPDKRTQVIDTRYLLLIDLR